MKKNERKKKLSVILAVIFLITGTAAIKFPAYLKMCGEKEADRLMEEFTDDLEDETDEKEENSETVASEEEEPPTITQEDADTLSHEGVIGIIEIKSIDIRYPIIEGSDSDTLSRGIGHLPETCGIGEEGNCVLCGHNGYRGGTFFTPLCNVQIGDIVSILDKKGRTHEYKIVNTKIVGAYDNSIKATDGTEKLTLFTCTDRGTKRFVCECEVIPKENVNTNNEKGKDARNTGVR